MAYKIYTIFMVLCLLQAAFSKPLDDSPVKPLDNNSNSIDNSDEDLAPEQVLMLYVGINFLIVGHDYISKAVNVSHLILKDESLLANDKPEVVEFKKNLTSFVENYESSDDFDKTVESMDIFDNITKHYLEMPEEKLTPESTFIVNILKKYKYKDIATEFIEDFEPFLKTFKKLFEEHKKNMKKPMLEWYEKFITLSDVEEQINAFDKFMEMAE